jgi:hypothetical protein
VLVPRARSPASSRPSTLTRLAARFGLVGAFVCGLVVAGFTGVARADDDPFAPPARLDPPPLRAQPGHTAVLEVHFDAARRRLGGHVSLAFDNITPDPLDHAALWLYPNRFRHAPPGLDDVTFHWIYPEGESPGSMTLTRITRAGAPAPLLPTVLPHAQAGDSALVRVPLDPPLRPGERVVLEIDFEAQVPERFGPFGCASGMCTLLGGISPMLASLEPAGFDLEAPPERGRITGRLTLAKPAIVVAGASPAGAAGPPGAAPQAVTSIALTGDAGYVPIVLLPEAHVSTRTILGVELTVITRAAPPPAADAERQTLAYTAEDYADQILDVLELAVQVAAEAGAPAPKGTRLTVVEAPLRLDLAVSHPGLIVVSDRMFRIFPAKRFRRYHARELVRAGFEQVFAATLARPGASARERGREAGVAAAYFTDLYTLRSDRKYQLAQVMLAPVAFIPAIDQLIYAPQVAFSGAYFGGIKDDDQFRDDVRRFSHVRPRPALFYEKLRDLCEPAAFLAIMRDVVNGRAPLRAAAETALGEDLGWFFAQWNGRFPRVNYVVGEVETEPRGTRFVHHIVVEKQAIAGDRPPVEPVTVAVVDGDGGRHTLRWNGKGARGVVEVETTTPELRSISVDPAARLPEAGERTAATDPEFDNRTPPRWTFLYNNFGAQLDSQGNFGAIADFSFKRVRDNQNLLRFFATTSESVLFGVYAGYTRRFGPRVLPNLPLGRWGGGLSLQRLNDSFAGLPGSRLVLSFGVGQDDRILGFEPRRARTWVLGARYAITRFDDDGSSPAGGDLLQTQGVSGEYTLITTPRTGHTVAMNVEGAVTFGDLEAKAQLLGAGGVGGLRGYGLDEIFGRLRVTAHVEYRLDLVRDLDWNLGHLAWLRTIGLAAFVDAGAVSGCESYGVGTNDLFAGAGGGIRFFYDNFGVQSGMTAIDVAVPLVRRSRACFGEQDDTTARPPLLVYFQFVPPF